MNGKLRNMATIYIKKDNKMLLLDRIGSKVVGRSWCGIGGHFEPDEVNDAKAAVLREMNEEIGLAENDLNNLDLRYIALRLVKDELRINYYFFADLKDDAEMNYDCDEGILEWISFDELNSKNMPYTAQKVIAHYLESGINTTDFYSVTADDEHVNIIPVGVS
ncbi:MAG: NUDIX domain-containing protein [Eubacterium sp.]|nr:NUDIX domain-containing protein [Eubacterium sp.]MDE6155352.1 NUDIX domain-containing protein [Eubacterium sp.]